MKIENLKILSPTCMIKENRDDNYQKFKQALNHGLVLNKIQKVIKLKQKAWLKSFIDINTDLRKIAISDF